MVYEQHHTTETTPDSNAVDCSDRLTPGKSRNRKLTHDRYVWDGRVFLLSVPIGTYPIAGLVMEDVHDND